MYVWLLTASSIYIILGLLIYTLQHHIIFHPGNRELIATPDDVGLEFETFVLPVEQGETLHGWIVPPPKTPPAAGIPWNKPLWVHFSHGNAGNISHRLETLRLLHDLGLGACIYDYRGYGQSTGTPDEQGTYHDAAAVWEMLAQRVPSERIIIWGRSLGGAIAAQLGIALCEKGQKPAALILESTFSSIVAMGKRSYPMFPVKMLCRHTYATLERIGKAASPLLVIHSPEDDVVPYEMGREIFAAAPQPKQFLTLHGGHNRGFLDSGETYTQGVRNFILRHLVALR